MVGSKSGLQIAIDVTIKIAQHLPGRSDRKLFQKTVDSIFDDQLKAYTNWNRRQRHAARKDLKEAMKKYEAQ